MKQEKQIKKLEAENSKLKSELSNLGKMVLSFINEDLDRATERQGVLQKWVEECPKPQENRQ